MAHPRTMEIIDILREEGYEDSAIVDELEDQKAVSPEEAAKLREAIGTPPVAGVAPGPAPSPQTEPPVAPQAPSGPPPPQPDVIIPMTGLVPGERAAVRALGTQDPEAAAALARPLSDRPLSAGGESIPRIDITGLSAPVKALVRSTTDSVLAQEIIRQARKVESWGVDLSDPRNLAGSGIVETARRELDRRRTITEPPRIDITGFPKGASRFVRDIEDPFTAKEVADRLRVMSSEGIDISDPGRMSGIGQVLEGAEREAQEGRPLPQIIRGGPTAPGMRLASIPATAIGMAGGMLREAGNMAADALEATFPVKGRPPAGQWHSRVPALYRMTEEDVRGMMSKDALEAWTTDLGDVVLALPALLSALGGLSIDPNDLYRGMGDFLLTRVEAGSDLGRDVLAGAVGGTAALLRHPVDSFTSRPLTFSLTVWSLARSAMAAGGAGASSVRRAFQDNPALGRWAKAMEGLQERITDQDMADMTRVRESVLQRLGRNDAVRAWFRDRWQGYVHKVREAGKGLDAAETLIMDEIVNDTARVQAQVSAMAERMARDVERGRVLPEDVGTATPPAMTGRVMGEALTGEDPGPLTEGLAPRSMEEMNLDARVLPLDERARRLSDLVGEVATAEDAEILSLHLAETRTLAGDILMKGIPPEEEFFLTQGPTALRSELDLAQQIQAALRGDLGAAQGNLARIRRKLAREKAAGRPIGQELVMEHLRASDRVSDLGTEILDVTERMKELRGALSVAGRKGKVEGMGPAREAARISTEAQARLDRARQRFLADEVSLVITEEGLGPSEAQHGAVPAAGRAGAMHPDYDAWAREIGQGTPLPEAFTRDSLRGLALVGEDQFDLLRDTEFHERHVAPLANEFLGLTRPEGALGAGGPRHAAQVRRRALAASRRALDPDLPERFLSTREVERILMSSMLGDQAVLLRAPGVGRIVLKDILRRRPSLKGRKREVGALIDEMGDVLEGSPLRFRIRTEAGDVDLLSEMRTSLSRLAPKEMARIRADAMRGVAQRMVHERTSREVRRRFEADMEGLAGKEGDGRAYAVALMERIWKDRGGAMPMALTTEPVQLAGLIETDLAQGRLARDLSRTVGRSEENVRRTGQGIVRDLRRRYTDRVHPALREHLPEGARWIRRDVNAQLGWRMQATGTLRDQTTFITRLGRSAKRAFTTLRPSAHINNYLSTQGLLQTRFGASPWFPIRAIGEAVDYLRWKKGGLSQGPSAWAYPYLEDAGLLDTTWLAHEVGAVGAEGLLAKGTSLPDRMVHAVGDLADTTYQWGDAHVKLGLALREAEKIRGWHRKMDVGSSAVWRIDPTRTVKVARTGPEAYRVTPHAGRFSPLERRLLDAPDGMDRVAALAGAQPGIDLTFDYGRAPGAVDFLRGLPDSGIVSSFIIWAWKALDLPGKRGLVSRMIESGGAMPVMTDSPAIKIRMAAEHAMVAGRRALVLQSLAATLEMADEDEVRDALRWLPRGARTALLMATTDPEVVDYMGLDPMNWAGPTETAFRIAWTAAQGVGTDPQEIDRLWHWAGKGVDTDLDAKGEDGRPLYSKEDKLRIGKLRALAIKEAKGGLAGLDDWADLAGIGGNILAGGVMQMIRDAEEGRKVDLPMVWRELGGALLGGAPHLAADLAIGAFNPDSEWSSRFQAGREIPSEVEHLSRFMVRKILGKGWRRRDLAQVSKTQVSMVGRKMADRWKSHLDRIIRGRKGGLEVALRENRAVEAAGLETDISNLENLRDSVKDIIKEEQDRITDRIGHMSDLLSGRSRGRRVDRPLLEPVPRTEPPMTPLQVRTRALDALRGAR